MGGREGRAGGGVFLGVALEQHLMSVWWWDGDGGILGTGVGVGGGGGGGGGGIFSGVAREQHLISVSSKVIEEHLSRQVPAPPSRFLPRFPSETLPAPPPFRVIALRDTAPS